MKRVLVVDDHPLVIKACHQLFETMDVQEILAATNASAGYDIYASTRPDVAVVDLRLDPGDLTGLALIRKMRSQNLSAVIVAFSMDADPAIRAEAFNAGATAFVCKDAPISVLLDACKLSA
jgi:DNA-binding NarL/FixJ family response regulator